MADPRWSDRDLTSLLRDGNRAYLKRLADRSELTHEQRAMLTAGASGPTVRRGVWVPLIWRADAEGWPGVLARVDVAEAEPGRGDVWPPGVRTGTAAAEALTRALDDAWGAAGMQGLPRPPMVVRCTLAEALQAEIDGPSMYLGVFLVALAFWSGEALPGRVIASGCARQPLGALPAKRVLIDKERQGLGEVRVLFLGEGDQHTTGEGETWSTRPQELAEKLWGGIPWKPGAPGIHRVQVSTRSAQQWEGAVQVNLPAWVEPAALDEAERDLDRVLHSLPERARIELRIRAPLAVASRLGHATVVDRLRVVSLEGDLSWRVRHLKTRVLREADARVRSALEPLQTYEGREGRFLLLARSADTVVPPWVTWPYLSEGALTTEALEALVQRVDATVQGLERLHLAIEGPVVLAWALGDYLRNKVRVCYWQRDPRTGRYAPWFEG
jgi:hypothetical protein